MERIILENVSKVIRNVKVLNDINLFFEKGKIYGLKGYNGSGKTMLLRMIEGFSSLQYYSEVKNEEVYLYEKEDYEKYLSLKKQVLEKYVR